MNEYLYVPLGNNVTEMFIGPFGSSLKNECFVSRDKAFCMVYEQRHAIQKTMDIETRYVDEQKYNELKRFNVQSGDIIVSCRGTIGETFIVPKNAPLGIMHPSIMKIRLKDGVYDKYYFNLLLKTRLKKYKAEANGSGVKMAISATELGKEIFPVPTMAEQLEITSIISKTYDIIEKRKKELQSLDNLIKARFVEMFGDPKTNPKNYPIRAIKNTCSVITGNTPSRKIDEYYGDLIEWIKTDNIVSGLLFPTTASEYLSESGKSVGRTVDVGAILMVCIAGSIASIGRVCVTDREVAFNQQINAIVPKQYNVRFLHVLLQISKGYLAEDINMSLKGIMSKSKLEEKEFIVPPMEKQIQFATFVHQVDKSKVAVQKALDETQVLFDSLMQKYFG